MKRAERVVKIMKGLDGCKALISTSEFSLKSIVSILRPNQVHCLSRKKKPAKFKSEKNSLNLEMLQIL